MKRIVSLTITAILLLATMSALTGCIITTVHKEFEIDADTVSFIEIYDLCEIDSLYGDFVKTATPVYEIPDEKVSDFLSDLAEIRFSDSTVIALVAMDPSFYYDGWTVRINYTDGSYELISCDGFGQTYDKNGEETDSHHFGCDNEEWWAFISQYVPQDIFSHSHKSE